jgi:hypothetical protein
MELLEPDLFDLGHAEACDRRSEYSLQSVVMACGAGLVVRTEPELKSFSVKSRGIDLGDGLQSASTVGIPRRGGGGCEVERCRTPGPAKSRPGDGRRGVPLRVWKKQSATMVLVEPTGSLRKRIGWWVRERTDPVVIDHFDDLHLFGARAPPG